MKKPSAFNQVKPRTPRGEARQREIQEAKAIEELLQLADEADLKQRLVEHYGITREHPKYAEILATWREYQRGRL